MDGKRLYRKRQRETIQKKETIHTNISRIVLVPLISCYSSLPTGSEAKEDAAVEGRLTRRPEAAKRVCYRCFNTVRGPVNSAVGRLDASRIGEALTDGIYIQLS